MRRGPQSLERNARWCLTAVGDAAHALVPDLETPTPRGGVRQLTERHHPGLTALLEREPGNGLFLAITLLSHLTPDVSSARSWACIAHHRPLTALMLAGSYAMPGALPGAASTQQTCLATGEGVDFTLARANMINALLAICPADYTVRYEEHYLAALIQPSLLRIVRPLGVLVGRAAPCGVDELTRLFLGTDGTEDLSASQLRRVPSRRVRTLRTSVADVAEVAEPHGQPLSVASTRAEDHGAALVGGVRTAHAGRNRDPSAAVVAAPVASCWPRAATPLCSTRWTALSLSPAMPSATVGFQGAVPASRTHLRSRVPA